MPPKSKLLLEPSERDDFLMALFKKAESKCELVLEK